MLSVATAATYLPSLAVLRSSSRRKPGSILSLLLLVIPAKAGIQGLSTLSRCLSGARAKAFSAFVARHDKTLDSRLRGNDKQRLEQCAVEVRWPALAKMDPGFRRDDGQRRKASLLSDDRSSVKSPWIPAFAGMTSKGQKPEAKAGQSHVQV
jgi:hypothetical protein